jgi:hypothetical protein
MLPHILIGYILGTFLCIKHKWPISADITIASAPLKLGMAAKTFLGQIIKQDMLSKKVKCILCVLDPFYLVRGLRERVLCGASHLAIDTDVLRMPRGKEGVE